MNDEEQYKSVTYVNNIYIAGHLIQ